MKIFKRAVSIILALALLFALTACGNDGSGAALSYPIESQPECLDPQIAQGAEAKTVVLNCFEGLARKDSEGKFSPARRRAGAMTAPLSLILLSFARTPAGS